MREEDKREFITPKVIVYSLVMTNWLCMNGFPILKVEMSYKHPDLCVFFFEDTPELKRTMGKFRRERNIDEQRA